MLMVKEAFYDQMSLENSNLFSYNFTNAIPVGANLDETYKKFLSFLFAGISLKEQQTQWLGCYDRIKVLGVLRCATKLFDLLKETK